MSVRLPSTRGGRRAIGAAVLIVAVILIALALRHAGSWLVVADPLRPAVAIVVLGGQGPLRAIEAAAVYSQGWSREVWLTPGHLSAEDAALARLGIHRPTEVFYSRQVLERLGVAATAIRELPGAAFNTADEMRIVAGDLAAATDERVIFVTSKYHTRRVKMLWRTLGDGHHEAIVRYTRDDPFEPDRWWRTSEDAGAVAHEWMGLANALLGFPVRSER